MRGPWDDDPDLAPKPPIAHRPVRVRTERRRYGKVVTTIDGLDAAPTDLRRLAARLKSAVAAGGTVKGDRIELQGDHRERVAGALRRLGLEVA